MLATVQNPATALDAGMVGWLHSYARSNFWRVSSWYDYEDLVQDGFLCYAICLEKYALVVKEKEHFMALLKRTYWNHVTDLSVRRTRLNETPACDLAVDDDGSYFENLVGGKPDDVSFAAIIRDAPNDVAAVLKIIITDVGLATLRKSYRRKDGTRETLNERLCKLVGFDPDVIDLSHRVRMYLSA